MVWDTGNRYTSHQNAEKALTIFTYGRRLLAVKTKANPAQHIKFRATYFYEI